MKNPRVKDDPKGRVYALDFPVGCRSKSELRIWRQRRPEYLPRITMWIQPRSLSFSLSPSFAAILSHTFSQGVINSQHSTRGRQDPLVAVILRPRAPPNRLRYFSAISAKERQFRFYDLARPNFYPITNFANRQKFPAGRYTRDARDDPNRTRCPKSSTCE